MLLSCAGILLTILALGPGRPSAHKPVVCVDPGHPSEINDGLQRVNGTTETAVNWRVAVALRTKLEAAGIRVVMSKSRELQRVENRKRAEIANGAHATLMIRLHADSGPGTGFRIFYPDHAGRHDGVTGPTDEVRRASARAAEEVHRGMAAELKGELHDNGVAGETHTAVGRRFGALIGSIHSQVPAVTVEMVFLTNPRDAAFIKSDRGRDRLAAALARGVENYLASLSGSKSASPSSAAAQSR